MTVLMNKSICVDCVWKESCQTLARINGIADNRQNYGHTNMVFEAIILTCSLKNYDRSYKTDDKDGKKLFYCTECGQMHREGSKIGISHKKVISMNLKRRIGGEMV